MERENGGGVGKDTQDWPGWTLSAVRGGAYEIAGKENGGEKKNGKLGKENVWNQKKGGLKKRKERLKKKKI